MFLNCRAMVNQILSRRARQRYCRHFQSNTNSLVSRRVNSVFEGLDSYPSRNAGGSCTAVNSATGVPVWHFETGQAWRASPMTYMVGGTQYMVLAGDGGIQSFALVQ